PVRIPTSGVDPGPDRVARPILHCQHQDRDWLRVGLHAGELLTLAQQTVVPLVKTMGDKLVRLREFGETRARPASTKKAVSNVTGVNDLRGTGAGSGSPLSH